MVKTSGTTASSGSRDRSVVGAYVGEQSRRKGWLVRVRWKVRICAIAAGEEPSRQRVSND